MPYPSIGTGGGGRQTFSAGTFADLAALNIWGAANLSSLFNSQTQVTVGTIGEDVYEWTGANTPSSYPSGGSWTPRSIAGEDGQGVSLAGVADGTVLRAENEMAVASSIAESASAIISSKELQVPSGGPSNGSVAASNVTVSSAALNGLLDGSGTAQEAFERIDATGLGAPITEFAGSYTMTEANRNEWLNRHIQGEDGQSCSRNRAANLPNLAVLGGAFDFLFGAGADGSLRTTVSYLGCSSTSSLVNSLRVNPITNVDNAPGGLGFRNNIVLNRADSVTLEISRTSNVIGSWVMASRGQLPTNSGATLDDIQLQDRTWANLAGTFLPGSDDVLKGYAFKVSSSPDASGDIRSDLTISATTEKTMYNGDWVVWSGDTFTNWNDESEWFVIHDEDVRRITQQESNFLAETSEDDTDNYVRIADDSTQVEALVWLVNPDNSLTTAPFLNPNTGSNPDPRNNPTVTYIGGRDDRNSDGDFVFDLSRFAGNPVLFQGEIIIGITGSYVAANNPNDIRMEIRELGGESDAPITTYNLNDNFVDDPAFGDLTLDYSTLSTFKISDSQTLLRYHQGQQIRLTINRPNRQFGLSSNVKVSNDNILGGTWGEDAFSTAVLAKLNKETSFTAQDRARLDGVETSTGSMPIPSNAPIWVRAHSPSYNDNHYRQLEIGNGLIQDFQETFTYTIRINNSAELTGFDFTGGRTASGSVTLTEILPTLFENERTYTLAVPPAPDDITYNPLDHVIIPTGVITPFEASGLAPTVKVDADNFDQAFLDSIVNHEQTALPASLQALNNQATVIHFDNTDFASNNAHAGIESMFAFLKNRPDERQGDTPPTNTTLLNEITNSEITATIADTVGLFYPRTIGGDFDDGVSVHTQGALTGPGSVNEPIAITSPSNSNYRMVLGFWFDTDQIPDNTIRNLIRVRERGQTSSRRLFGIEGFTRINEQSRVETGILITERVFGSGGTSAVVPVPHHLYTTNGELIHIFSGVGIAETLFRVNLARQYTISFALTANGNAEGDDSVDVTIANLAQNQDFGQHTLNFTADGHPHTQTVRIEYVANDSTYGGPGHTLRVELVGGLTDNSNFDIDHLAVSAGYETQETITTPASYAEANAGGTPLIKSRKKHRMIFSFRKSASNDNLQCHYVVTGFDDNGNPVVSSSNTIDFGYSVFDLDWSQVLIGNTNMFIAQNIQGFFLNTDTPLDQFPTHDVLNGWITSHDDKATDYVWDNAAAPSRNVEVARFPENVNFPNLILEDTENSDRFRLVITNGALNTVKVV